jgi:hypothetical protein
VKIPGSTRHERRIRSTATMSARHLIASASVRREKSALWADSGQITAPTLRCLTSLNVTKWVPEYLTPFDVARLRA